MQEQEWNANVAAARGAVYLDGIDPDWYNKVDIDTLELTDCIYCVLGQLYGSYLRAVYDILNLTYKEAIYLGFTSSGLHSDERFYYLTTAWKKQIQARRDGKFIPEPIKEEIKEEVENVEKEKVTA